MSETKQTYCACSENVSNHLPSNRELLLAFRQTALIQIAAIERALCITPTTKELRDSSKQLICIDN